MAVIKTLPEAVARQIAAGEVVERPASVVKELIENALDAGAGSLWITTGGAGVDLIEIRDDGCGMAPEDAKMAARNFATSKIESADELFRIGTFGFRGEALAAISAVSRLEIVTSDRDDGEGWRVAVEGKSETKDEPAPHERGTTVRMADLFFNTPARKKFLKSAVTERRRILEVILGFALVAPSLEIHYADDGRRVLDLVPSPTWEERVAAIMGSTTMTHMVAVEADEPPMRVSGFVSLPTYTRANRNNQFLYVNGRLVREKTMIRAVQEAYRNVIPFKRFPAVVLAVEAPYEDVDVNVHPTKLEVRLSNERRVFDIIRRSIKKALTANSEETLDVGYARSGQRDTSNENSFEVIDGGARPRPRSLFSGVREDSLSPDASKYKTRVRDAVTSYFEERKTPESLGPKLSLQVEDGEQKTKGIDERIQTDDALFWQFNNSYIFIQVRGGIVVIDQHAAHERIIYDTSKKQLESEIPVSQQILFPITLELSLQEFEVFRSTKDVFHQLGFHLEPFGGMSILVRGYPQGLKNWEEGRLLRQMFDDILNDKVPGNTHGDQIIASFACRSAVKAGQKLNVEEMKMLADQLFAIDNPYSCPHGRPTIHRISIEEMERWFSRR
jgi:DNA mismatch repair protein MutL